MCPILNANTLLCMSYDVKEAITTELWSEFSFFLIISNPKAQTKN
jgi:hypothetical protein